MLPRMKPGFVSAHSPYWLGNHHRKLGRCQLRNHQWHCFPSWRLDSSTHKVPLESEINTKNWVAHASEIVTKTTSPTEAWIRHRTKTYWLGNRKRKLSRCRLRNHQWQCFPRWSLDSSAHTVPLDSEITIKKWVAHGSEIITETASLADARFCLCTQSRLSR